MPNHIHRRWPGLSLACEGLGTSHSPVLRFSLSGVTDDVDLWIKDERLYGNGPWGGNKVRKLEWILPEARRRRVRTLVSVGSVGSHWGVALAHYAHEAGFKVVLALIEQPRTPEVMEQFARLEDSAAELHLFKDARSLRRSTVPLMMRHTHRRRGDIAPTLPWMLRAGGSNKFGTLGYVEAGLEIAEQVASGEISEPALVVVPAGSGGTAAGLALGFRIAGLRTKVLACVVNHLLPLDSRSLVKLANDTGDLLRERGATNVPVVTPDAIDSRKTWLGQGLGHATEADLTMVQAAHRSGLEIEPTFAAKSLLAVSQVGASVDGPVLWLNMNGLR